jgi:mitotic-spindle organizing protein 1
MDPFSVAHGDQAIDVLQQIATILDTGVDKETLRILVGLCEAGVNPDALATVVKELRREASALKAADVGGSGAGGGSAPSSSAAAAIGARR